MGYTFEAGPDEDRYTVETPWATRAVDRVVEMLGRAGFERTSLHGAMLMLLSGSTFDGIAIESGTGGLVVLGEVRAMLNAC